jgi:hypothetical protein
MKYHRNMNFVPDNEISFALDEWKLSGDERNRRTIALTHPSEQSIVDKSTFFDSILYTFPLDPPIPIGQTYHWDAIQDSVRGGLWSIREELIDIVWYDVHITASNSIPTLVEGIRFLLDATDNFQEKYWGIKNVYTRILLVYAKEWPSFSKGVWFPK